MTRRILSALAVCLLLLPLSTPDVRGQPADPLSVMTFNIRYGTAADGPDRWELRRPMLLELLRSEAPDLIGLQEALRFQIDELLAALPGYSEVGVGRDDGRSAGEHAAILLRRDRFTVAEAGTFWFSDTPGVPGSRHWGNGITRISTWVRLIDRRSDRAFYLFNLHLDHQSQPSRERSVELLAARMAARTFPEPVIVTGDFNAGEQNTALCYLRGESDRAWAESLSAPPSPRLRDSFRLVHPEADSVGTFHGFQGGAGGEKIDYILVDGAWEVLAGGILRTARAGRYPSDHYPVTARLRLRPAGDRL
jgi:endonuclease/exonuclease/phosphatase family metal-dependent hydrolase